MIQFHHESSVDGREPAAGFTSFMATSHTITGSDNGPRELSFFVFFLYDKTFSLIIVAIDNLIGSVLAYSILVLSCKFTHGHSHSIYHFKKINTV